MFHVQERRFWMGIFLVAALAVGSPLIALGGEPGPGSNEQINGPAIAAVMTATQDPGGALVVVSGSCKKTAVSFGPVVLPTPGGFINVTASSIENFRLNQAAPAVCFPPGGGDLIVTGVTNFNNDGNAFGADLSISLVQPKK